ncbi:hypothetical protein C2E23DRAFT_890807 [Lenzites betulinus]|nr:hypothetical protein C2E23DRAFT_890807 [Lenzites betulinus]
MPRFLNTWTGMFEWHNHPQRARYVILSHTWRSPQEGGEQSHADILKLQAEVAASSTQVHSTSGSHATCVLAPIRASRTKRTASSGATTTRVPSPFFSHPNLSAKIAKACETARNAGFELLWIDACCIDKTSSAELAEAINSMYEWYRLADVCYVFLQDVCDEDVPHEKGSRFRSSRWHTRGWTLQELIAPGRVIFLTQTWSILGSKIGLATTLESISGVDFAILTGEAPVDSASVARRMSWAARRETTRVEDRAYSLLGVFGVHLAPIYGEDGNAFLRLQQEILKIFPDQTIFAWGHRFSFPGLVAYTPSDFRGCGDISKIAPADFASKLQLDIQDIPPLHVMFTPQGVRINLLCVDLYKFPDLAKFIPKLELTREETCCEECAQLPHAYLLALLQCQTRGNLIALALHHPPPDVGMPKGLCPGTRELCAKHWLFGKRRSHVFPLQEEALTEILARPSLSVVDLSVLLCLSRPETFKGRLVYVFRVEEIDLWPKNKLDAVKFDFDSDCIPELDAQGYHLSPMTVTHSSGDKTAILFSLYSRSVRHPWTTNLPRQRIAITVSLTPAAAGSDFGPRNVLTTFSVANFTCGLSEHSDSPVASSDPAADGPESPFYLPLSAIVDKASGAHLSAGTCERKFPTSGSILDPMVDAKFVVYAGPSLPEQDDGMYVRSLRVLLRYRREDQQHRIYVAVELFDVHKFVEPGEHPITSRRPSNSCHTASEEMTDTANTRSALVQQPTVRTLSDTVESLRAENNDLKTRLNTLSTQMATVLERVGLAPAPNRQDADAVSSSDGPKRAREDDLGETPVAESHSALCKRAKY